MPRIFFPDLPIDITPGTSINAKEEVAHYLYSVLRVRAGQSITVFGPGGVSVTAEVVSVRRGRVGLQVLEALPVREDTGPDIVLVQGLLKGAKMDMVIQKAVELGASRIVPVITQRSQVRQTRKGARWSKIAQEAARQCGRTSVPGLGDPIEFSRFLDNAEGEDGLNGFVFYEDEQRVISPGDRRGSSVVHVLVGPEGGLVDNEVAAAAAAGFVPRGLGSNILRAETAAIASLAIVRFIESPAPASPAP